MISGADPVLERGDDLAPGGVVLGVGGEGEQHVQRQPHRIAFDLDVAFLHDIEQAYLDFAAQIGQLVDGKDAAVGAGSSPKCMVSSSRKQMPPAGRLDRVDVADQVRDGHVRSGQLLHVTLRRGRARRSGWRRRTSASSSRAYLEIGAKGSSLTSLPATIGIRSSSSVVSSRRMRLFGLASEAQQDEMMPGE